MLPKCAAWQKFLTDLLSLRSACSRPLRWLFGYVPPHWRLPLRSVSLLSSRCCFVPRLRFYCAGGRSRGVTRAQPCTVPQSAGPTVDGSQTPLAVPPCAPAALWLPSGPLPRACLVPFSLLRLWRRALSWCLRVSPWPVTSRGCPLLPLWPSASGTPVTLSRVCASGLSAPFSCPPCGPKGFCPPPPPPLAISHSRSPSPPLTCPLPLPRVPAPRLPLRSGTPLAPVPRGCLLSP